MRSTRVGAGAADVLLLYGNPSRFAAQRWFATLLRDIAVMVPKGLVVWQIYRPGRDLCAPAGQGHRRLVADDPVEGSCQRRRRPARSATVVAASSPGWATSMRERGRPMQVAIALFPGNTALDAVGPRGAAAGAVVRRRVRSPPPRGGSQ